MTPLGLVSITVRILDHLWVLNVTSVKTVCRSTKVCALPHLSTRVSPMRILSLRFTDYLSETRIKLPAGVTPARSIMKSESALHFASNAETTILTTVLWCHHCGRAPCAPHAIMHNNRVLLTSLSAHDVEENTTTDGVLWIHLLTVLSETDVGTMMDLTTPLTLVLDLE